MMRIKLFAVLPVVLMVAACSGLPEKVNNWVGDSQSKAERAMKEIGHGEARAQAVATVVHENGVWIAKNSVRLDQKENLPRMFYEPATFDRVVSSLEEFAERITIRSGISVKVTPDAASASQRLLSRGATGGAMALTSSSLPAALPPGAPSAVPPLSLPPPAGLRSPNGMRAGAEVRIVYPSGNLKGLLDTAAARFGVFWKYDNAHIRFFFTDTRTFQISAIPGDSALSATVASGSSNGGVAGGSAGASPVTGGATGAGNTNNSQNTEVKSQLSVYSSIEKSIAAMLSVHGKVVASPATGSISVTDTPDILERVTQFVENENKTLSRQVMINVTVLSVNISDSENYGLNWNLLYGDLSRKFGVTNNYATDAGSTSFSAAILNTATSKFAGSSLMINALSSQGRVRRETTASVVALNNQPVPVQVAKQTAYLQSSQTTVTANVGSTTALNPGTVTSGFNMTILPHVLNNGTVMLQFSTDMSSLRRIRTVSSNGNSIESPELDTRNFLQRVAMKSGETLVISGFEQMEDGIDGQGVGKANNFLLGGGYKAQTGKEVIVILVTPIIVGGA